jgi:N-acetylglucosaminyldiphosphoundecaprenol N-acetyl-beta-D-mannosaminyltransferase
MFEKNVMGFNVFNSSLEFIDLLESTTPSVLNTISPNSYGISTKDENFRKALQETDYLVLDGVYFALASILKTGRNIKKNQGPDIFYHFMSRINKSSGKVFFLGSSETTLLKISNRANFEYPNIKIETFSPPFKAEFNDLENQEIINKINTFKPDIVFVGMTCPKQEKWSIQNKNKLNTKLICSIGAVFDWYAGNEKPIHPIWWKLRLAWLKRTVDRPEILKRYPNIGIFFRDLILKLLRLK